MGVIIKIIRGRILKQERGNKGYFEIYRKRKWLKWVYVKKYP